MKVLVLLAAAAALIFADEKAAPKKEEEPTERTLSEAESLKLQLLAAKIQILQDKYKIADYQKEMQPLADEQNALITQSCVSVGVPRDQVQTQCALNLEIGPDGKSLNGPDGKPLPAKVWWNKSTLQATPVVSNEKK